MKGAFHLGASGGGVKKEHKKSIQKATRAKAPDTKVFDSVTTLVLTGSANIRVLEDGTINGAEEATQSGSTLTLVGEDGGGGNIGVIGNVSGSGISISGGGMFVNHLSGSTVTINGRTIDLGDLDRLHNKRRKRRAETRVPTTYKLGSDCVISAVSSKGAANLLALPATIAGTTFAASVAGSGDITLPRKVFQCLTLSVAGSGDIHGNDASTATATMSVAGSGDIRGLSVTGSGVASVVGSGDISIRARNPSSIIKQRVGSGSIRVR